MSRIAILALVLTVIAACGDTADGDDSARGGADGGGDQQATRPVGGEDVYAVADLTVEVVHPDREPLTYRLTCAGDTATIDDATVGVEAEVACRRLTEAPAVALLVDGPDPDRYCAQVYGGPDEAHVTGTLDGRPVDRRLDRTDGCAIDDWDRVLGGVLPPPAEPS
jgi:hypothetical protein